MVSGVCFREADTCMLYPLVFNCRSGDLYVMCAKSVAVTSLCVQNCISLFLDERGIHHYLLSASVWCVCLCESLEVHEHLIAICLCACAVVKKCNCG